MENDNKEISMNNTKGTQTCNLALHPANFLELKALAIHMAKSGFLGVQDESQALTLMMLAHSEGKNLVQACMDYHIIKGKPALTSQATLIRFQQAGGKIKYIERTDEKVTIEFSHAQAGVLKVEWNMERAKKAGLAIGKDTWTKYPRQMLNARCLAEGVRALYPACLGGVYLVEEVQEFNKPHEPIKEEKSIKDEYSSTSYNPATDSFESSKKDYLENKEKEATQEPVPVKLVPEHIKEASDEDTIDLNKANPFGENTNEETYGDDDFIPQVHTSCTTGTQT